MFICQECGGQNGLHFSHCHHSMQAAPRISALPRVPVPASPSHPPYMHTPTGRTTMEQPQIQNLPGTLAHAIEMAEAKRGPVVLEGLQAERYEPRPVFAFNYAGNMQAGDPSQPHRSMPQMIQRTNEQKLIDLLGPDLKALFTHRDKGGRYVLFHTPIPAGEVMRKVGDTVVYSSIDTKGVYVRDLADFVAIMQPLLLSDS